MEQIKNIVETIDVEPDHLKELQSILAEYLPHKLVWAYGSRVSWTATERSDLDLIVFKASSREFSEVKDAFDESNIPFIIQILRWEDIPTDFRKNIKEKYVVLQTENSWRKCTLGEVAEITSKKVNINKASLQNYISTDNMNKNFQGVSTAQKLPTTKAVNIFTVNNILFSNIRTYFKKVWYSKFDGTSSADVLVFRSKRDCISKFLFYQLCDPKFTEYSVLTSRGAKMPRGDKDALLSYKLLLPPLPTQKAIAEVLSSLDDKIDLLHRQNKTLEAMAEAMFRQWFVEPCKDGLPEGWEISKLSEIAEIQNGYSFSSKNYIEYGKNVLEVLKMGHIEKKGGLRANPKKNYVLISYKLSKFILNKHDIVMAMTDMKDNVAILGVPAIVDKNNHYVLNQRVARISLKNKKKLLHSFLLYVQLKDSKNIQLLQTKAHGGVQVNLSTQAIKDIEIITPDISYQQNTCDTIINLYERKEINDLQIKNVEKLRDTLLPKLMSGKVEVRGI